MTDRYSNIKGKATSIAEDNVNLSCRDRWNSSLKEASESLQIVRKHPKIPAKGVGVFGLFFTLAVALILFATENAISDTKHEVYTGTALELEHFLTTYIDALSNGVQNLASYISIIPNCSDISESFDIHAEEIFRWDENIVYLSVKPSYVVKFKYPPTFENDLPIGYDALAENPTFSKMYVQNDRDVIFYSIPKIYFGRIYGMFAQYNIWKPVTSYEEDLGCNLQPTNCSDVCYREDTHMKFYGIVNSLNNMTTIHRGDIPVIQNAIRNDLALEILVTDSIIGDSVVMYKTDENIVDVVGNRPIRRSFIFSNLNIDIQISANNGWTPSWTYPCVALAGLVSLFIGFLVMWILITKHRHKLLLASMLPRNVIRHLEKDIINFTVISSQLEPLEVVEMLHGLYSVFDNLSKKHGVYKVETIGDAFMAVSGCPFREEPELAAMRMALFATNIVEEVAKYQPSCMQKLGFPLEVRVGLHSGAVVAGVVGNQMPRFCLFGDTVNTASRMESHSESMRVHASSVTAALLNSTVAITGDMAGDMLDTAASSPRMSPKKSPTGRLFTRFSFSEDNNHLQQNEQVLRVQPDCPDEVIIHLECRGEIHVKGKGCMTTYWISSSCQKKQEEFKKKNEENKICCVSDENKEHDNEFAQI